MLFRSAALVTLCAACGTASAAEFPLTRTEPVIVTATRFEEHGVERPINMTVITAEDIRSSPARTVPDILAERAGIFVRDLFGNEAASASVDLRGFGVTGTQNTLILVDGRRIGDIDLSGVQWSAVPLSAIERIEIVRGGGSVLYGEGATAGVINIITRAPRKGASASVARGTVGSYNLRESAVDGSIGVGQFGANVFGSHLQSNGYRRNNENRQTNALGDFRWYGAAGDVAVKLATDNQGIRLPGARTVQPSAGLNQLETDRRGAQTPFDWAQREGNRALIDLRRKTSFGEIDLGAGWREKQQRSYFDFGGFPDFREVDLSVWSFTPRTRVNLPLLGRPNTLVAGLDAYSWEYALRRSNSPTNAAMPFNSVDARQDTVGVYVLDTIEVTPRLSVAAGARRERLRIHASDVFDPSAPGAAFGSGAPAASQRLYESAYELGGRYDLTPATALMLKTTRSYRFANVDEIYETSAAFTNQFQFLRPQTSRSHELGIERHGARHRVRAAVFVIDVNDEIHLDPFTSGVGNRNLPPSRRRGFELEANAQPLSAVRVGAAYSYVDAGFREGVLAGSLFTQQNVSLAGKTVPLVPRHKVTLRATWDVTSATRFSAVTSYVAAQFMDNDEPNSLGARIPAYTVTGLKLTHQRGAWRIAASINNVFDQKYYNYAVRSQFVADRYNAYPLPERNGWVSVEYHFQ